MQNTKQEFYTKCDELTLHVMQGLLQGQGCKRFETVRVLNQMSRAYFGVPAYDVKGKDRVDRLFMLIITRSWWLDHNQDPVAEITRIRREGGE